MYLAAGVPVLLSRTPAQARLGQDLGAAAIVDEPGDVAGLAERLSCLARDSNRASAGPARCAVGRSPPLALGASGRPRRAGRNRARRFVSSLVMTTPLRVLITADPYIPVPPLHYGGIERVIDVLVRELVRRGHDVTIVAHPDSRTPARLVPYGEPPHAGYRIRAKELVQVGSVLWRERRDVDVVHSFGRLAALLPVLPRRHLPKVQTYQRDGVPWTSVARAARLAGSSLMFTGCSSSVYRHRPPDATTGGDWRTVFNCVDLATYTLRAAVPRAMRRSCFSAGSIPSRRTRRDCDCSRRRPPLVIAGNRVTDGPMRATSTSTSRRISTATASAMSVPLTTSRRTACLAKRPRC